VITIRDSSSTFTFEFVKVVYPHITTATVNRRAASHSPVKLTAISS